MSYPDIKLSNREKSRLKSVRLAVNKATTVRRKKSGRLAA